MKWVKASERSPEVSGYYITESEWIESKPGQIIPNDRSDTYFNGEKWLHGNTWKVIKWIDESPAPKEAPTGMSVEDQEVSHDEVIKLVEEYLKSKWMGYNRNDYLLADCITKFLKSKFHLTRKKERI